MPKFFKQTVAIKETIKGTYNEKKEWKQDPKGYFLIRVGVARKRLEAGFVTNKHTVTKMIYGKNAREVYYTIIREKIITKKEHIAYLAKELYKAELCLRFGARYVQDSPLKLSLKDKVKIKENS